MKIAVNTTVLKKNSLDATSIFVQEVFKIITQQNPQHEFIFIFDKPFDQHFIFSKNITPIIVKSSSQSTLAKKYWYNIKLPFSLKKYKPDVLIQTSNFCSAITILQLLIIQSTRASSLKKNIGKSKQIATTSQFLKNDIIEKYKVDASKIDVVYSATQPIFKPLIFDEILQTKDGYADGREYFLLRNNDNLMNVLKAFSLFKKWQHSNMKLLVVGSLAEQKNTILNKLKTYKYRDDVVLLNDIDDNRLAKLIASAYCVLYPSFLENFAVPIIEAMQSGVPVITSNTSSMKEVGGDIALYANPNSSDEIAEQMQLIYKDEILRSKLIKEGLQQATKFSWDKTAKLVWASIERMAKF